MNRFVWLCLPALISAGPLYSQTDYAAPVMAGISNHGRNPGDPYVTAGDRAYLIGTQDGEFPDLGEHVPGEMGGLWVHPVKVIDGFWVRVTDMATEREVALMSSSEFINYPYGNRFRYRTAEDSLEIERFQFSPDGHPGVVVQYSFKNPSARARRLRVDLAVKTDLSPVWYSDRIGIRDAPDTAAWNAAGQRFVARDREHSWFAVWGAAGSTGGTPLDGPKAPPTRGPGVTAASRHAVSVAPRGTTTLTFVFAGSATSKTEAIQAYRHLAANHASLLKKKEGHYAAVIDRARIRIPDRKLQEVYNWVRVNMEWLVREVPGMGRGLSAGLMEYPWWFGTESYSLQALTATGDFELVKQMLRLMNNQSRKSNGNGRIVHEVTTNGAVSNPGNSQETAQFIMTVGKLVDWTGDAAFAREMYPAMKQGLNWLLTEMDPDHNLFPGGYGIMEVLGLNAELIDVSVYTQQALLAGARVAGVLGESGSAERYSRLALQLQTRINQHFWVAEEGSYGDFYGTRAQAISAAEGAMKQIRLKGDKLTDRDRELIRGYQRRKQEFEAMPDSTRGWITNKNWVISTPMEMGIAPRERAIALLDKIRKENLGEHGPYLSAVERLYMMTIATGVQAVSEARYGRTDEALWYMNRIVETFNRKLPGSISEMMPDYGCFAIAWTSYGIVLPLIEHVFGIRPDAVKKTVVFEPQLPSGWEEISIEDLPVGTNLIAFSRAKTGNGISYRFRAKDPGWTLVLKLKDAPGARYSLNGKPVGFDPAGIRMSGGREYQLEVRRQ